MSDHESDTSEQEGFVPYQIEVKTSTHAKPEREKPPSNTYEPHYLIGTPMMR